MNKQNDQYISSAVELELAKAKGELVEKFYQLQADVERSKFETEKLQEIVSTRIDAAQDRASSAAIDKTLSLLTHVRFWIFLILAIIGGLSVLGYTNLEKSLTETVNRQVKQWLNFSGDENPVFDTLDKLRTETILNAYSTKLYRDRLNHAAFVSLNEREVARLLEILKDPKSSYKDFSDALDLISETRGPVRMWSSEDSLGKTLADLINNSDISGDKRFSLLKALRNDEHITEFAKALIQSNKADDHVKAVAFENIKMFDDDFAFQYAESNLNKPIKSVLAIALAVYLQEEKRNSPHLQTFISSVQNSNREDKQEILFKLTEAKLEALASNQTIARNYPLEIFANLLESGGTFIAVGQSKTKRSIAMEFPRKSGWSRIYTDKPIAFLDDSIFLNAILGLKPDDMSWLKVVVEAFQIVYSNELLNSVVISPGKQTVFVLANGHTVTGGDFDGNGRLESISLNGKNELFLIWRGKTGEIKKQQVVSVKAIADSELKNSFDDEVLWDLSERVFQGSFLGR